jgi:NDP-sugar pyrophosphorylase family protein
MKTVILAGGRGTRLKPLTDTIPKPLLPIGRKPILEIIIERLREHGFSDIILNVKYMAESIKAYFRDGSGLNVKITYFEDNEFCGTAGPIKLVEKLLDSEPFITMNGDLLTDLDFNKMYHAHIETSAELTMATYTHTVEIPFGVIQAQNNRIISIDEKPSVDFLINAGIYIVSPSVLDVIPENTFYNMPDLIQNLIDQKRRVEIYPIDGKWQDIGTVESYNQAKSDGWENKY